jgi:hypothetical protein
MALRLAFDSIALRHGFRRVAEGWALIEGGEMGGEPEAGSPDGDLRILLDEGDPVRVSALEHAFAANRVTEDVLFATGRGIAPWMASVTFGGPDLKTVYIGSLKGTRIPCFRAPVAGLPMVHWNQTVAK